MSKKSLVQIRNSDIRWKQNSKLKTSSMRKRQRKLFEFDIPTASCIPVKRRNNPSIAKLDIVETESICIDLEEEETNSNIDITIPKGEDEVIQLSQDREVLELDESDEILEIVETDDDNDAGVNQLVGGIMSNKDIICPICNINLSELELYEREAHCETCVESLTDNRKGVMKEIIPRESKGTERFTRPKRVPKPRSPLPDVKILTFENKHQIVVDGFNYGSRKGIDQYFLSHFHSDHYTGIKKSWEQGFLYCSKITSDLVQKKFKIHPSKIIELPNDEFSWIAPTISVIPMDANHCPGAQIYLFQEWETANDNRSRLLKQIVHTGDFRSNNKLIDELKLHTEPYGRPIDEIYLDTTYLEPSHNHPSQELVIDTTASFIKSYLFNKRKSQNKGQQTLIPTPKKKLILVGSYAIGKEKLAEGIASMLNCPIYVHIKELRQYFMDCGKIDNDNDVSVHIVPLRSLKDEDQILKYLRDVVKLNWLKVEVVGLIPTGWTFSNWGYHGGNDKFEHDYSAKMKISTDSISSDFDFSWFERQVKYNKKFQMFKVPYSEHSNFHELVRFSTNGGYKWNKMISTVNLNNVARVRDMNDWFRVWREINNSKL